MTKYIRIYNRIIEKRKKTPLNGVYTESHHILPKSLGGDNSKNNIVKLSAKEHYIVHHLLWKHYKKIGDIESYHKMSYAFWCMCIHHQDSRKYINSSSYEKIKIDRAEILSEKYKGENNPNYGNGDKIRGENNPNYGVKRSKEWKKEHSKRLRESGKYKKENNSASKEYYVVDTINDTKTHIKKGHLREFCEDNNIKYTTLYSTCDRGTPITRGKGKGLLLKEVNEL